jgi:hypothetical protein
MHPLFRLTTFNQVVSVLLSSGWQHVVPGTFSIQAASVDDNTFLFRFQAQQTNGWLYGPVESLQAWRCDE